MVEYWFNFYSIQNLDKKIKLGILMDHIYILTLLLIICYIGFPLTFLGFIRNKDACCENNKYYNVKLIHASGVYECVYTNKTTGIMVDTMIYNNFNDIPWNKEYVKLYVQFVTLVLNTADLLILFVYICLGIFIIQTGEDASFFKGLYYLLSIIGIPICVLLIVLTGIFVSSFIENLEVITIFIFVGMPIAVILVICITVIIKRYVKNCNDYISIPKMEPISSDRLLDYRYLEHLDPDQNSDSDSIMIQPDRAIEYYQSMSPEENHPVTYRTFKP